MSLKSLSESLKTIDLEQAVKTGEIKRLVEEAKEVNKPSQNIFEGKQRLFD
jgi:hypothetical protein